MSRGALAIVLHTHMPYVEGFGTWPLGEELLWEAIAASYLPLLDVLDAAPGRVTMSLTPVLADQLAAPMALDRCAAFLRETRPETHRRDLATTADPGVAAALERSAARYAAAADALDRRGRDLLGAFAPHVSWTSAATHPLLPLLASDAGVRLQLATGVGAHRARFGGWSGGFWLPECGYAPWLDGLLAEAGVRAACVDFTDVLGLGAREQLQPQRTDAGPLLVPIDRAAIELVWGARGYPSRAPYRAFDRLTPHHHRAWAVDGAPYDEARAERQVAADAREFVAWVGRRVRDGGLCVCALDTELLGHWWLEGPAWLAAVLSAVEDAGLTVLPLDAALGEVAPTAALKGLEPTSWGDGRDLSTWSGPRAGGLPWRQRQAELDAVAARVIDPRALRELLALQASDWPFAIATERAADYGRERFEGHSAAFRRVMAHEPMEPELRGLAPYLASPGW